MYYAEPVHHSQAEEYFTDLRHPPEHYGWSTRSVIIVTMLLSLVLYDTLRLIVEVLTLGNESGSSATWRKEVNNESDRLKLKSAEVFGPVAAAIEKLSESYETTTVTTPPGTTVT
ncbi:uncharacterized protein [Procambarus clarkii]|uniref:uncharacterized protein n=1 Tax=Procambarus clarkii TaxID=6728 RepID=UPI001E675CD9|nr:uncharacterized protein LOC123768858 [Procambarus clarkii]